MIVGSFEEVSNLHFAIVWGSEKEVASLLSDARRPASHLCLRSRVYCFHMSYSLSSLMGGYMGDYVIIYGTTIGVIKGDTRSLEHSSYFRNHLVA